ncbi:MULTISPECIES: hypothetical protein [Pseudonocardia]|uniref:Uncharacterized protein n=2 Tax=Pseudonocardia TaxID=1847 RepID=A0A1Y2MNB4_PSEAH|nr:MULTISPECIES: hypothetical protein [Pseudonocardia]OSY36479.1 hypothetical protein BG845_05401 [Pseudonocardia autotrophica]TDN74771.1 hypothetical protein C8E95_3901 [Pseudonocardia autotrophica]BBG05546.1 hypothetical protein Pdca_67550 [Pseudonocardia autotrophica]GEC29037.1 hypothetical protein PSA01_60660 [Pseudonocardia saturnea]
MPYEVVSAYTLVLGGGREDLEHAGPDTGVSRQGPEVSVHTTAEDAWRALDAGVRERCGMRPRPRRSIDPDAVVRLADAWRAADPVRRYWNVTAHRLPIMVPEFARTPAEVARTTFGTQNA